ncbi:multicopper oxidase [Bacillus methanolicus MGA3]|nr:multicopper oxidase [Bacillus methanolicus MGA3]
MCWVHQYGPPLDIRSMGHDMNMYDTINGKSGSAVEPLKVKKGAKKYDFAL